MDIDLLQTIANIGATIAAITAIVIGIYQFRKQQNSADRIAHANIKPLLKILYYDFDEEKKITLDNLGLGTAIITSVKFHKDNEIYPNVSKVSELLILDLDDHKPRIDNVWKFLVPTYIRPGSGITIAQITRSFLKGQKFDDIQIDEILKSWARQLTNISIEMEYTDVLGEKQENYQDSLKH